AVVAKNPDFVWRNERGNDFGDRFDVATIRAEGEPCTDCTVQKELYATALLARSARTTAKMAFAAGDEASRDRALAIADGARRAFAATFIQGGRIAGDTQAAYALALDAGLYS